MTLRRSLTVTVWLGFLAACVFVIGRSTFNADMSAFLPKSPTPQQKVMVDQLRDGVVSRLILVGLDGASVPQLARISQGMRARLSADPELVMVSNGERVGFERDFELLWRNRYLLSDAVAPGRFGVDGLRSSLSAYLDLLSTPMSGMAQQVLPQDPSGELIHLLEGMEGQGHPLKQEEVWFSRDGQRAMLLVQTRGAGSDIDAQERAMHHIQSAFDAATQQERVSTARVQMTGPGVFSVQSRASISDDAWRLSLIATVLVASMLLFIYRSMRVLLMGLFPVTSGALAGVAAVSLVFGSVHGITLGFGVTLIGEGVDYAIYLFTQMGRKDTPQSTLQRIWPTLRLGVLTSICGFSAMLFSSFTGLAQLGLFSISGLLVAVATTRWVLPGWLPAGFSVLPSERFSRTLMMAVRYAPRARPLLLVLVAAAVLSLVQRDALWNDSLASMSPVSRELQALDQQLRDDMGAPDVRYLLVTHGDTLEEVLQRSEDAAALLQTQVGLGRLAGVDTPPLPSRRRQAARQAALPEPDQAAADLRLALRDLPYRSETFAQFPQEIAQAKRQPLLDAAQLQGSSLGLKLDSFLRHDATGWSLLLPLHGVQDAPAIEQEMQRAFAAQFTLLDMKRETEQMFHDYRREATQNALLGVLAIVALLSLSLRSVRRVLDVALPLLAAVIVVSALLLLGGKGLSIFHLVGLLLVVAVGSNYSLFFESRCGSSQERERTITSLVFANASTVLGFGLLSFSQAPVLSAIGTTVAGGAVLSLIFSAVLISRNEE
ncbi:MMPL family transporter [Ferriphaselus sp. R-1]|uniref:MMPL family transporter n=1 Tax=Ferriphaselus sp. R-1 TaxID=1485544 RepID=UPI000552AEBB|nr:MMPL family transporter [Ferriphaselus sp. R-1]